MMGGNGMINPIYFTDEYAAEFRKTLSGLLLKYFKCLPIFFST